MNPVRPKQKAAAGATGATVAAAYLLRLAGLDLDSLAPELLLLVGGALASAAAILKKDGLRGAWMRLVNGEEP